MKLKEINLSKTQKKGEMSCFHPDIKENKSYLAKIYDHFYAGEFSSQWYGFSFNNWGNAGIQLNSDGFQGLWEIVE